MIIIKSNGREFQVSVGGNSFACMTMRRLYSMHASCMVFFHPMHAPLAICPCIYEIDIGGYSGKRNEPFMSTTVFNRTKLRNIAGAFV